MNNLLNRTIDAYGNVIFEDSGLLDLIYAGGDFHNVYIGEKESVDDYNKYIDKFGVNKVKLKPYECPKLSMEDYHSERAKHWNIPEEYLRIDLIEWFSERTKTKEQEERVAEELALFFERKLENLLRLLIYIVDTMRANNIIWGVGRGSSVSSYCLYLIGIHRIDSIKYNLDIKEFLK